MGERLLFNRGNAAITAVSLASLLGFGALAVDISYIRVTNAQLQVALEAGVLGGSGYLDGTVARVAVARDRTVQFVAANHVFGGLNVTAGDVIYGYYDMEDRVFEPRPFPATDEAAQQINAIRLDVVHSGLGALLAGIAFGQNQLATAATATAVRDLGGPAGAVDCFLPIVIPSCMFPEYPGEDDNQFPVVKAITANATKDNAGWATQPDSKPNKPSVTQQLNGDCAAGAELAETMNLMNGVANPIFNHIANLLNSHPSVPAVAEPWPEGVPGPPTRGGQYAFTTADSAVTPSNWGKVIGGPIALVELNPPGAPGTCAGAGNFTQGREIKGFAYAYIYDVEKSNGGDREIFVQLDFKNKFELGKKAPGQTGIGNVTYPPVAPVLIY